MLKDGDVPRTAAVASGLAFWPDRTKEVSLALRFRARLYDFWLSFMAKALFFKANFVLNQQLFCAPFMLRRTNRCL